ncbi:hypothetical protein [Salipaludibacillus aurantiacus]|uniref:Polyhydroxyalkanoic acid inclusion protein (PhaP_Bmeg) n=1 Tax=Salipaludibacillus aurantiacus TaxID=1601833 RepID=A0A1H9WUW7_9BACI|nr:hypothetical protein [Salipaludibacillus aurantiacus]SES37720.1 Polyhydroxyalkanoic acid inclusion protein (PhaP_Bmeg) [Salipaludibacillus aurantiacus]
MVVKKETNKTANENVIDFFGVSMWKEVMEKMEQQSMWALKTQKEWIDGTREQFSQFEENSKKFTTEWKTSAQTAVGNVNQELEGDQKYHELLNKIEEIGHKSQTIATLPGKASLDIMARSNAQITATIGNTFQQNKKIAEKTTDTLVSAYDQMRQTQMQMLNMFQTNSVMSK